MLYYFHENRYNEVLQTPEAMSESGELLTDDNQLDEAMNYDVCLHNKYGLPKTVYLLC